jgi:hypothetical protein
MKNNAVVMMMFCFISLWSNICFGMEKGDILSLKEKEEIEGGEEFVEMKEVKSEPGSVSILSKCKILNGGKAWPGWKGYFKARRKKISKKGLRFHKKDFCEKMKIQDNILAKKAGSITNNIKKLLRQTDLDQINKDQKNSLQFYLEELKPSWIQENFQKLVDSEGNNMLYLPLIRKDIKLFERILCSSGEHNHTMCGKTICDGCRKGRVWALKHENKRGISVESYLKGMKKEERKPYYEILERFGFQLRWKGPFGFEYLIPKKKKNELLLHRREIMENIKKEEQEFFSKKKKKQKRSQKKTSSKKKLCVIQ